MRAGIGAEAFWREGYAFFFGFARRLAEGAGYVDASGAATAFRVPLYPLVLAGLTGGDRAFWPVLLFQAAVSTGTVACAALLARDWFGPRAALCAAAICAVYPYYLIHDTSLAETGLFTFLTALGVWLAVRARARGSARIAAAAGLALGLAVLTRATIAPFVPVAAAWLAFVPRRRGGGQWIAAGTLLAVAALTLTPWLAYSQQVTGRASLGTEFGAALFGGNNDRTFSHYPAGSIDASRGEAFAALSADDDAELARLRGDEAATSDWYEARGRAWIAAHPGAAAWGALRKLGAAFGPLPSPRKGAPGNAAHALSYGPIALLALVTAWRRRRWREHLPIYALFAIFAAITAVLWGHTAHRSFLDVYLIVFAAPAILAAVDRRRRSAGPPREPDGVARTLAVGARANR
ncbi:MAG TPA: glycosyltransferase family 39 protein, partial [Novosphingobium sp.]|nr:glycosyltransferase family 39 protein [Novosphingobium sp.]